MPSQELHLAANSQGCRQKQPEFMELEVSYGRAKAMMVIGLHRNTNSVDEPGLLGHSKDELTIKQHTLSGHTLFICVAWSSWGPEQLKLQLSPYMLTLHRLCSSSWASLTVLSGKRCHQAQRHNVSGWMASQGVTFSVCNGRDMRGGSWKVFIWREEVSRLQSEFIFLISVSLFLA